VVATTATRWAEKTVRVWCASIVDGRMRVNSTLVGGVSARCVKRRIMIAVARLLSNVRHPQLLLSFLVIIHLYINHWLIFCRATGYFKTPASSNVTRLPATSCRAPYKKLLN